MCEIQSSTVVFRVYGSSCYTPQVRLKALRIHSLTCRIRCPVLADAQIAQRQMPHILGDLLRGSDKASRGLQTEQGVIKRSQYQAR